MIVSRYAGTVRHAAWCDETWQGIIFDEISILGRCGAARGVLQGSAAPAGQGRVRLPLSGDTTRDTHGSARNLDNVQRGEYRSFSIIFDIFSNYICPDLQKNIMKFIKNNIHMNHNPHTESYPLSIPALHLETLSGCWDHVSCGRCEVWHHVTRHLATPPSHAF